MTISIQTKTLSNVLAYHQTLADGETGFVLNVGGTQAFLSEKDADKLGRYLLFNDDSNPATPYPPAQEAVEESQDRDNG